MKRDVSQSTAAGKDRLLLALALGVGLANPLSAQNFSSGSTGEDGPFNPACTPTPCTVTVALPPSGVFNFTTVDIPQGVTVIFKRNAANTPVTMLATGDVTISGRVDVSGEDASSHVPGRGGPGGFDGGMGGNLTAALNGTPGSGPGGGGGGDESEVSGSGGSFGTRGGGSRSGPTYGVSRLLPLIGGSGGGGARAGSNFAGGGGGGGGGALLIASSGAIRIPSVGVERKIVADGGDGGGTLNVPGGGSGGAIRLVANALSINSGGLLRITASGGGSFARSGGSGRIRYEAFDLQGADLGTTPPATVGTPGPVTPPTGFPTLRITAVGGVSAPANPQGSFYGAPDITLSPSVTNPVTVDLAASNIPLGTVVTLTVIPEAGARTTVDSTPLTGTEASSTATASVNLTNGVDVLIATGTFATPSTAALAHPMMFDGEKVKQIRVGTVFGGASEVTYITESGREVEVK